MQRLPAELARHEAAYHHYLEFGSLVKGGQLAPNWLPDGSCLWYAQGDPNERQILKFDPAADEVTPLFDVGRLRLVLRERLGHEPAGTGMPFDELQFLGPERIGFSLESTRYELDLERYELSCPLPGSTQAYADLVPSEAERAVPRTFTRWKFYGTGRRESAREVMSPEGRWMLGIDDHNAVLRATVDGQRVALTADGTQQAFWDFDGALWNPWSPDGLRLALLKQHTEGMAHIPVVEWLKPREQVRDVLAMPAGGALYRSELYLLDPYALTSMPIDLGDTMNQYLRILSWLPDGSELLLARYDRVFSRVDIQAVNALTSAVRTLLTERSATFLAHHQDVLWGSATGFALLPDGSGFIWRSGRDGWDHLYSYDMQCRLQRQLTRGEWGVEEIVRIDPAAGWVYFTGHDDQARPYDTHLYRVGLHGEGFARLTEGIGQHRVSLSPSARYFIDTFSAVDVPPVTVVRKADGTLIRTLCRADIGRLKTVGWVPPREYVVKAADAVTDLWATLYFPYDFDPTKKYPVVEYIYGGPQTIARPVDFNAHTQNLCGSRPENFNRALANLGFVVVTLDARGTPGRSREFQNVVYRRWGQFEIADHAGALRQLAQRLPFLDLERVGVWGWSWGGQFAFRALTQAPDLYRVGISGWPAFDPRRTPLYEVYLGLPRENKAAYEVADAFALAPQLRGQLLLIGGMNDPSTQADLFKMSELLIRLGKQHRVMIYPCCGHGAVGRTAEYDMELKKRFFVEHLIERAGYACPH
jgi:dipeptidyl aminopeptidase/acylaminoacyl peptidase